MAKEEISEGGLDDIHYIYELNDVELSGIEELENGAPYEDLPYVITLFCDIVSSGGWAKADEDNYLRCIR